MNKKLTLKEIEIIYLVKLRNIYSGYIMRYKALYEKYPSPKVNEEIHILKSKRNSLDRRIHKLLIH